MKMKKTIGINAVILLACLPVSGVIGWLALRSGIGPRYVGYSTWGMIVHHIFSPVTSGIMATNDPRQNITLAGPPILFLVMTVVAVVRGWRKTSFTFSALASLCWVLLVMLTIYARALP
jgi:hypothetical protein